MRILLPLVLLTQASALEILGVDYAQSDKQGHVWLGAATSGCAILAWEKFDPDAKWYTKLIVGTLASSAVGAVKEWSDHGDPFHHAVEFDDYVATATGGFVVAATMSWRF